MWGSAQSTPVKSQEGSASQLPIPVTVKMLSELSIEDGRIKIGDSVFNTIRVVGEVIRCTNNNDTNSCELVIKDTKHEAEFRVTKYGWDSLQFPVGTCIHVIGKLRTFGACLFVIAFQARKVEPDEAEAFSLECLIGRHFFENKMYNSNDTAMEKYNGTIFSCIESRCDEKEEKKRNSTASVGSVVSDVPDKRQKVDNDSKSVVNEKHTGNAAEKDWLDKLAVFTNIWSTIVNLALELIIEQSRLPFMETNNLKTMSHSSSMRDSSSTQLTIIIMHQFNPYSPLDFIELQPMRAPGFHTHPSASTTAYQHPHGFMSSGVVHSPDPSGFVQYATSPGFVYSHANWFSTGPAAALHTPEPARRLFPAPYATQNTPYATQNTTDEVQLARSIITWYRNGSVGAPPVQHTPTGTDQGLIQPTNNQPKNQQIGSQLSVDKRSMMSVDNIEPPEKKSKPTKEAQYVTNAKYAKCYMTKEEQSSRKEKLCSFLEQTYGEKFCALDRRVMVNASNKFLLVVDQIISAMKGEHDECIKVVCGFINSSRFVCTLLCLKSGTDMNTKWLSKCNCLNVTHYEAYPVIDPLDLLQRCAFAMTGKEDANINRFKIRESKSRLYIASNAAKQRIYEYFTSCDFSPDICFLLDGPTIAHGRRIIASLHVICQNATNLPRYLFGNMYTTTCKDKMCVNPKHIQLIDEQKKWLATGEQRYEENPTRIRLEKLMALNPTECKGNKSHIASLCEFIELIADNRCKQTNSIDDIRVFATRVVAYMESTSISKKDVDIFFRMNDECIFNEELVYVSRMVQFFCFKEKGSLLVHRSQHLLRGFAQMCKTPHFCANLMHADNNKLSRPMQVFSTIQVDIPPTLPKQCHESEMPTKTSVRTNDVDIDSAHAHNNVNEMESEDSDDEDAAVDDFDAEYGCDSPISTHTLDKAIQSVIDEVGSDPAPQLVKDNMETLAWIIDAMKQLHIELQEASLSVRTIERVDRDIEKEAINLIAQSAHVRGILEYVTDHMKQPQKKPKYKERPVRQLLEIKDCVKILAAIKQRVPQIVHRFQRDIGNETELDVNAVQKKYTNMNAKFVSALMAKFNTRDGLKIKNKPRSIKCDEVGRFFCYLIATDQELAVGNELEELIYEYIQFCILNRTSLQYAPVRLLNILSQQERVGEKDDTTTPVAQSLRLRPKTIMYSIETLRLTLNYIGWLDTSQCFAVKLDARTRIDPYCEVYPILMKDVHVFCDRILENNDITTFADVQDIVFALVAVKTGWRLGTLFSWTHPDSPGIRLRHVHFVRINDVTTLKIDGVFHKAQHQNLSSMRELSEQESEHKYCIVKWVKLLLTMRGVLHSTPDGNLTIDAERNNDFLFTNKWTSRTQTRKQKDGTVEAVSTFFGEFCARFASILNVPTSAVVNRSFRKGIAITVALDIIQAQGFNANIETVIDSLKYRMMWASNACRAYLCFDNDKLQKIITEFHEKLRIDSSAKVHDLYPHLCEVGNHRYTLLTENDPFVIRLHEVFDNAFSKIAFGISPKQLASKLNLVFLHRSRNRNSLTASPSDSVLDINTIVNYYTWYKQDNVGKYMCRKCWQFLRCKGDFINHSTHNVIRSNRMAFHWM